IIRDYTACPIYFRGNEAGGHEWIIEFEQHPDNLEQFTSVLDSTLREINSDYDAKRFNDLALQAPLIQVAPEGTFYTWMKQRGKLGGQHKVPRLANERSYVEEILGLMKR
ncbi:MAG TPA: GH3 auxin-responsive promoter family protein, partial [Sphingobacteriaceae bacterium]